jgi:uncharacterized protein YlxW (UPF0749 family)
LGEGPGIVLTLRDAPKGVAASTRKAFGVQYAPEEFIIHDIDILRVVNTLRAAGALAISIDGERLTERSAIVCSGPTVFVNSRKVATPLRIRAAGDPDALTAALQKPGGLMDPKASSLAFMQMVTLERAPAS